jgi:CelD/BcsL family acetyltransferase involved in cellulose biosynthesis
MRESSPLSIVASEPRLDDGRSALPRASSAAAVSTLRFEVHRSFEAARAEWTLFQGVADGHPFQHHEWLNAWYEAVGRGRGVEPFIVVAKDAHGVVRAVYPLGIRKARWVRILVPLGEGVCDYHAPLIDREFFGRLPATSRALIWTAITAMAPADSVLLERVVLDEHGDPYGARALHPHSSSTHVLWLGDDWDRFYRERRGAKTRRTLREKRNRLARIGPIRFALAESVAERERLLALAVRLKATQLKHVGYRNPYRHDDVRTFYRTLAALSPTSSALRVFSLEAGCETVAVAVCMVHAGRLYYLIPAHDRERFGRFSPGLLLLCEMIHWSIEHGLKLFDFTIGDEAYKDQWCDAKIPLAYSVDGLTPRGKLAAAIIVGSLTLKRTIAVHPRLRPIGLAALDWLWSTRQRLRRNSAPPLRETGTAD